MEEACPELIIDLDVRNLMECGFRVEGPKMGTGKGDKGNNKDHARNWENLGL